MSAVAQPAADASAATVAATGVAGSSFYLALRVLPREQREAMYAIYGFCRAVDDIADGDLPREERRRLLEGWRSDVAAMCAGRAPPRLAALAGPTQRYGLAEGDFLAVIDGMQMDAERDIRAPDWATLDLYCDRVASAVGRLSVRVFGVPAAEREPLAYHLGRALQLANILRDLDEDAAMGRLYLPREALDAAGVAGSDPATTLASPSLGAACEAVAARARRHFAEAAAAMASCPRRATRAPRLMAAVYGAILDRMTARGWAPPRTRVRPSKPALLWIALRQLLP